MTTNKRKSFISSPLAFWLAVLFVMGTFGIYAYIIYTHPWNGEKEGYLTLGTFGDSFGMITCLFTGLGIIGLFYNASQAQEEINLAKEQAKRQEFISILFKLMDSFYRTYDTSNANINKGEHSKIGRLFIYITIDDVSAKSLLYTHYKVSGLEAAYSTADKIFFTITKIILTEEKLTDDERKYYLRDVFLNTIDSNYLTYLRIKTLLSPIIGPTPQHADIIFNGMTYTDGSLEDKLVRGLAEYNTLTDTAKNVLWMNSVTIQSTWPK